MKGIKSNLTKEKIEKAIAGRTWRQAAKLLNVSISCLRVNAAKFGVSPTFSAGKNPKLKTDELIASVKTIGLNKTAKKFRISVKRLTNRFYVWKHRGMI